MQLFIVILLLPSSFSLLLFIVAILFHFSLYLGRTAIKEIKETAHFKKNGILTLGYIEEVTPFEHTYSDGAKLTKYRLNISFKTNEGRIIKGEFEEDVDIYHVGSSVHIFYDSTNPDNFLINAPNGVGGQQKSMGYVFLLFAILSAIGSIGVALVWLSGILRN